MFAMASNSNQNRHRGFSITLFEGLLFAALLHLAVGMLYLYSNGYIDNFISRYRSGQSDVQSIPPAPSKEPVAPLKFQTTPSLSDRVENSISIYSGYKIDISVFQKGDELLVRGWVSRGAPCDMLEIRMELTSETRKKIYLWAAVEKVGGSRSRLINMRRWVGRVQGKGFPKWSASVLSVNCISN
jgi:hypothetical protein